MSAGFNGGTPGLTIAQFQSLAAQGQYWTATFYVTYAMEFLCLSVAKLLVLDCMADFELAKGGRMRRLLGVGGQVVMAVVETQVLPPPLICNLPIADAPGAGTLNVRLMA